MKTTAESWIMAAKATLEDLHNMPDPERARDLRTTAEVSALLAVATAILEVGRKK
jgi:hypothetical protein